MGATTLPRPISFPRVLPLRSHSDERLALLVARGDDEAFEVLYGRYREAISRYCRSIVRNSEDARDAEQNAVVNAYRALRHRPPTGKVRPWLYRIAHNESINVLRRRRGDAQLSDETPSNATQTHERLEAWEMLVHDLRSLPENQRAALLMRELAGLEYDEIGTALTITAVAARKSVFEARAALTETAAGRSLACEEIRLKINAHDGRALRARRVRGHLEDCASCSAFAQSVKDRRKVLATVPVIPASALGLAGAGAGAGAGATGMIGAGATGAGVGGAGMAGAGAGVAGSATGALALKGLALCGICAIAGTSVLAGGNAGHRNTVGRAASTQAPHRGAAGHTSGVEVAAHRAAVAHRAAAAHLAAAREQAARHAAAAHVQQQQQRAADRRAAGQAAQRAATTSGTTPAKGVSSFGSTPAVKATHTPAASSATSTPTTGSAPGSRGTGLLHATGSTPAATTTAGGPSTIDKAEAAILQALLQKAEALAAPGLQTAEQQAQQALSLANAGSSLLKDATTTLASALAGLGTTGTNVVSTATSALSSVLTNDTGLTQLAGLLTSLTHLTAPGTSSSASTPSSTTSSSTTSTATNPLAALLQKIFN